MKIYEGWVEKNGYLRTKKTWPPFLPFERHNESDALQFYDTISGRASVHSVQGKFLI